MIEPHDSERCEICDDGETLAETIVVDASGRAWVVCGDCADHPMVREDRTPNR